MILRRISNALRKQDWATVLIEILIVVVGVVVGIEVANWNEARLDVRKGEEFAERLTADLRVEKWNYDVIVAYLEDVRKNIDLALAVLEEEAEATDEQLLIYAYRATQYAGGVRRRATFDELTSTGSIGLITDTALRDTAVLFYTSLIIDQAGDEGINSPYRIEFRKSLPVDVQIALGEKCGDWFLPIGDYSNIENQLNFACETGLAPARIEAAASALRAAPEIVSLLRLQAMDIRTQISNLVFTNQDIRDSLNAVVKDKP